MSGVCMMCKSSDHLTSEDNLVICTTCGVVVDEQIFQEDDNELIPINSNDFCNLTRHTNLMKQKLTNKNFQTNARKQAKQMLEHCMSHFRFSNQMKKDANVLSIQLINSKHFYASNMKTKIILSGVCTYLIMVKFDYVITKYAVAKAVGCSVFEFGAIYKRALKYTNVTKPKFFTIDNHVTETVDSLSFDRDEVSQIENIVVELINFQRRCCPIDSHSTSNLILAASFYAWKCVKWNDQPTITLKQFLVKFNIKCNLNKYVKALVDFMIELCNFIPWITDKKRINKKTVYHYTQDVLEYPQSILNDYMQSKNQMTNDLIIRQSNDLIRFKRERESDESGELRDENMLDISDSEIDSYIRTEQEVSVMKKIKKSVS